MFATLKFRQFLFNTSTAITPILKRPSLLRPFSVSTGEGHPLWQFFENREALPVKPGPTGRAWRASELRNKSFDELHQLWYILLKERNMLATQREEAKRYSIPRNHFSNKNKEVKCRKSMARILTVLSERHLAYQALQKKQPLAQQNEQSQEPEL